MGRNECGGLTSPGQGFRKDWLNLCTPEAESGEEHYGDRHLRGGGMVELLYPAMNGTRVQVVGAGYIRGNAETGAIERTLHNHALNTEDNPTGADDPVVLFMVNIRPPAQQLLYPFRFRTGDIVPATLGNITRADMFVWDMRAVRIPEGQAPPPPPTPTPPPPPPPDADPPPDQDRQDQEGGPATPPRQPFRMPPDTQATEPGSDDDEIQPEDDEGTTINVTGFDMRDYKYTEVYVHMEQVTPPDVLLRGIERWFVDQLKADMRARGWSASSGTLSVTMTLEQSERGVKPETLWTKNEQGWNVMRENEQLRLVDGGHRKVSVIELGQENPNTYAWALELFPTHFYERKDGRPIGTFELMKLSKVCNNRSSTVNIDCTFMDHISNLIQYSILFEEHYRVRFLDARPIDILNDLKVSNFNEKMGKARNTRRYIFITRLFLRHEGAFEKVCRLIRKAVRRKSGTPIGAAHFEVEQLNNASGEMLSFYIDCIDHYLANPPTADQNGPLNIKKLYEYAGTAFNNLRVVQREFSSKVPTMEAFWDLNVPVTANSKQTRTVKEMTLNVMRLSPMPIRTKKNVSKKRSTAWNKECKKVEDRIVQFLEPPETPA